MTAPIRPLLDNLEIRMTTANTMGGARPRNDSDAYYTPQPLADAIARKLRETIGEIDLIIEPSAGVGAFVRAARATWPTAHIRAVEPFPRGSTGADWEVADTWESEAAAKICPAVSLPTLIGGNPPYNLPGDGRGGAETTAERHVRLALERLGHADATTPQPRWVAFLLRGSFLAGGSRIERLHERIGGLRYVWHVTPRPSFTGGGTDGAEYAMLVWQVGYRGPYEGGWLRWVA